MNFLDKMFDGLETVVGGIEKSKELSGDNDVIDAKFKDIKDVEDLNDKDVIDIPESSPKKARMLFVTTTETHILEGVSRSFICGSFAEPIEIISRKTEMNDGPTLCCGTCFRILYSRYMNG